MAIAREIVVGDEKPPVALAVVFADRALEIVRRAKPALAAWTLMIVQNEHW